MLDGSMIPKLVAKTEPEAAVLDFTCPDLPDGFRAFGRTCIISCAVPNEKTASGFLILPDEAIAHMRYLAQMGRIVSVGELFYKTKQEIDKPKVGDFVNFRPHAATFVMIGGHQFAYITEEREIFGTVDPKKPISIFT
jgi:co-chaperonin GroES (HSP10)